MFAFNTSNDLCNFWSFLQISCQDKKLNYSILSSSSSSTLSSQMPSNTRFSASSYQKLRRDGDQNHEQGEEERSNIGKRRKWCQIKKCSLKGRQKVKIPGLRRYLAKKIRWFGNVKLCCGKVFKRLKESKSHLNDIFAGNYLFMQVTPSSLKCVDKSCTSQQHHGVPSSKQTLGEKIA